MLDSNTKRLWILTTLVVVSVSCITWVSYLFQKRALQTKTEAYKTSILGSQSSQSTSLEFVIPSLTPTYTPTPTPTAFAKEIIFGHSVMGKEIKGYEIGYGNETILLFGSIHGNEKGSQDLLDRFIIELKQNPTLVSSQKKIIIIPMLNPDGFYDRTDKLNAHGVNIDLNFPTKEWKQYGTNGTYAGKAPYSEPESIIISTIVQTYEIKKMVSFHAHGAVIIPEDNDVSRAAAKEYAKDGGYRFYGGSMDFFGNPTQWFVETTGYPAFTVELSDNFNSDWIKNKKALEKLVE